MKYVQLCLICAWLTVEPNSGIPRRAMDGGLNGASRVVNEHECNRLCGLLSLQANEQLTALGGDDSEAEGSD